MLSALILMLSIMVIVITVTFVVQEWTPGQTRPNRDSDASRGEQDLDGEDRFSS